MLYTDGSRFLYYVIIIDRVVCRSDGKIWKWDWIVIFVFENMFVEEWTILRTILKHIDMLLFVRGVYVWKEARNYALGLVVFNDFKYYDNHDIYPTVPAVRIIIIITEMKHNDSVYYFVEEFTAWFPNSNSFSDSFFTAPVKLFRTKCITTLSELGLKTLKHVCASSSVPPIYKFISLSGCCWKNVSDKHLFSNAIPIYIILKECFQSNAFQKIIYVSSHHSCNWVMVFADTGRQHIS